MRTICFCVFSLMVMSVMTLPVHENLLDIEETLHFGALTVAPTVTGVKPAPPSAPHATMVVPTLVCLCACVHVSLPPSAALCCSLSLSLPRSPCPSLFLS